MKFGVNHDQIVGRYSDQLADYLNTKNVPSIPVDVPMYYRWGVAHTMGEVRVDGKDFPTKGGGYGSWSADRSLEPFPKYYFGLRDFPFAN